MLRFFGTRFFCDESIGIQTNIKAKRPTGYYPKTNLRTNIFIATIICKYYNNSSLLLKKMSHFKLNVEKYLINININLTLAIATFSIFAQN